MDNNILKSIAVISDPQINVLNTYDNVIGKDCEILRECFSNMTVDAVAVCGDITENSLPNEWNGFFEAFHQHRFKMELYLVPGNMDSYHNPLDKDAYFENIQRCTGRKIDNFFFGYEKDNCVLVGICPEPIKGGIITGEQLNVIEHAVRTASKRNIPAFILSHLQVANTIHIEWNAAMSDEDSKNVRTILEKHNSKVVFFSGHTHSGLIKKTGGSVTKINNVTYVSTPSITKPNIKNPLIDNNHVGTGYIIELSSDTIHIRGYDFLQNKWLNDFEWVV